ncbi:MAG: nucleoside phosphorylase [Spirochaetes bacterium]|nr:nucleoside phosphorylase [Spirochaetota bacterium]
MGQRHLDCESKDIAPVAMIVGDPERATRAALLLDDARLVNSKRGLLVYWGTYKGIAVTIATTMMGAPSAAIVTEELCNLGVRVFLRLGSAGAFSSSLGSGDIIIANAAIRDEGTSRAYLGPNFPAVADPDLLDIVRRTVAGFSPAAMTGIIRTHDAFYRDNSPGELRALVDTGVLAQEMETSCIYIVAQARKVRAVSLLVIGGNIFRESERSLERFEKGEALAIRAGLEALAAAAALPPLALYAS